MSVLSQPAPPAPCWGMRAVQLDLARQRETVSTILRFIDDVKAWGYTAVHLYLEGVIRATSFPYRDPDQSYSEDDIRQIVEHATHQGIELIPCIATLGHAEHFVNCPELAHLQERGSTFPPSYLLCPEHPETHTFLHDYLNEIASLFPGPHFNIGCDEAWSLGTCPRCRASGKGYWDLLIDHITRMHGILTRAGKRIWMWDDMFESADEATIARLPRDIVLCAWHYNGDKVDLDGPAGHFNAQHRRDWLTLYARLGFDVIVCPASKAPAGVFALTRYARQHKVMGALMTMWEMSQRFLPSDLPTVAMGGRLWSQPDLAEDEVITEEIERLLPERDESTRLAFAAALHQSTRFIGAPLSVGAARGPLTTSDRQNLRDLLLLEHQLAEALRHKHDDLLEAQHINARHQILEARLRTLFADRLDPRLRVPSSCEKTSLQWCRAEIESLRDLHRTLWKRHRPGLAPDHASAHYENLLKQFDELVAATAAPRHERAMLVVRLFLIDPYAAPRLSVTLSAADERVTLYAGSFKPADLNPGFYDLRLALSRHEPMERVAVELTVSGIGGQGVAHVSMATAEGTLMPMHVVGVSGRVSEPEAVLHDNASYCFLGEPDMLAAFHNRREDEQSALTVELSQTPANEPAATSVAGSA